MKERIFLQTVCLIPPFTRVHNLKIIPFKFFCFTFLMKGGGEGGVQNSFCRKIPIFLHWIGFRRQLIDKQGVLMKRGPKKNTGIQRRIPWWKELIWTTLPVWRTSWRRAKRGRRRPWRRWKPRDPSPTISTVSITASSIILKLEHQDGCSSRSGGSYFIRVCFRWSVW